MNGNELLHGKAYDCTIDGNKGVEKVDVVPLAMDAKKSQRYVIMSAKQLQKNNPDFFRRLLAMSFQEIVDEDLDGGPDREWSSFVWRFTIDEHGRLYYKDHDCYLNNFAE